MEQYNRLWDAIASYTPAPTDLLHYLRFERHLHGDDFCTDWIREDLRQYFEDEFWGTFHSEVPRDDDDCILVEEALKWTKGQIDNFYAEGQLAAFARTMQRTEALKEELMASVWHPRRIKRLLEIGGEEALDNFAGL